MSLYIRVCLFFVCLKAIELVCTVLGTWAERLSCLGIAKTTNNTQIVETLKVKTALFHVLRGWYSKARWGRRLIKNLPFYNRKERFLEAGWLVGFEPTTFRTTIWRSNLLNYSHHVWPHFWNRLQRYRFYLDIPNVNGVFSCCLFNFGFFNGLFCLLLRVAWKPAWQPTKFLNRSTGKACLREQGTNRMLCVWDFSLERQVRQT